MIPRPLTPEEAMLMAIDEGKKGAGFVSPNPLVGCVIVDREHRLLAKGHHRRLGDLHAETHALSQIQDHSLLDGAHFYVTLEPCAHQGRQPSCAKALAQLPIASVTFGLQDPHPRVAGQGAEILRQAGKEVHEFSGLKDELEELAEIFLVNWRQERAFVTLKVATSLDGRTALKSGESQWITGPMARDKVHELRGCHDAILTGAGTVLKDDPRLNSRHARFQAKTLPVVVLDPKGSLAGRLSSSQLLQVREPEHVWLITEPGVRIPEPITHLQMETKSGDFPLAKLLINLRGRGLHSLFVEAGETTLSKFLEQQIGDRLTVFMAPKILGDGLGWTSGLKLQSLEHSVQLKGSRHETLGEDWLVTGRLSFAQLKS